MASDHTSAHARACLNTRSLAPHYFASSYARASIQSSSLSSPWSSVIQSKLARLETDLSSVVTIALDSSIQPKPADWESSSLVYHASDPFLPNLSE